MPKHLSILDRLESWLKRHRRRYHRALMPGADAAALDALSARLGVPVPPDLRRLLVWHNGQQADFPGSFEQDWQLMSADEIAAAKSELEADPEFGWSKSWIPFLDDDAGDCLFLDTGQPGEPVRAFWQDKPEPPTVAPSLDAWLEDFVAALERGEYVEDPERGSFLRKDTDSK